MSDERTDPPTRHGPESTRADAVRATRADGQPSGERRQSARFPDHDRYVFREILGQGGQGVVFRVFDAELDRDVALKTLLPDESDAELAALFVEEARATARLGHPNIIPIFDVGRLGDDRPYYTMQLVTGRSLREVLRERNDHAFDPAAQDHEWRLPRLVQVVLQVCNALDLAHQRGVLHRDVKPANIMLGPFGEVLLVDWGIAKRSGSRSPGGGRLFPDLVASETELGTIKGTIAYMPPEALRGEPLTARADVYAVGVVLHEILTGKLPFDAERTTELIRRALEEPLRRPQEVSPQRHVPPVLSEVVVSAIAKEPDERLPSARALADELQAFLEDTADREKRLAASAKLRDEARAALRLHEQTAREAERLEQDMEELRERHPPWQPLDEKGPLIDARKRATELRHRHWTSFVDAANRYTDALAHVPDEPGVREELTDLFWPRFLDAEHQRRELEAVTYRKLVERFHDGRLELELKGDGSLDLEVSPAHAELMLHPLVEQGIALVDGPGEPLGRGDVHLERLPMGSYVVVATAEGCEPVRYPVCIERSTRWKGALKLPAIGSLPDDFVFIPGTRAWQGGDPSAKGSLDLHQVEVSSAALSRHLVTFDEYCVFLAECVDDPASPLGPRVGSDGSLCTRTRDGAWVPFAGQDVTPHFAATFGPAALGRVPVFGVTRACAHAYLTWASERHGRGYRLPTAAEWELAARGTDRRIYPWGNRWDDAACHTGRCFREEPDLAPVGTFALDAGPHGVRGLAGELCEWTSSWFDEARQLVEARGGAWDLAEGDARAARRRGVSPGVRNSSLGFRLALDV